MKEPERDRLQTPPDETAPTRHRLLVLDDEAMLGKTIRRLLSQEYEVTTCVDPEQALSCLASGDRFDVILCDLMMPKMTGMQFYDVLTRSYSNQAARVVFLTGGAFTDESQNFARRMQQRCLEKPIDGKTLTAALGSVVRQAGSLSNP